MVFSSIFFLLYFLPSFLVAYHIAPRQAKNWIILVFSILFYAWGAPIFIFVLMGSTIIDFYLVKSLYLAKSGKTKKHLLILSLVMNLGLLGYFKYANFFIDNVNEVFSLVGLTPFNWVKVVLPIGISFYTFQTLTYSIDVYRGVNKPLEKLRDYLVYILSFPQMIAGPIVRFSSIAKEITYRQETVDDKLVGFSRFCIGLGKKVLIANVLGQQVDQIMGHSIPHLSTFHAWVGIVGYAFQIYFDFSGYSDMAIGLGKMMGFTFPENFNSPYVSKSITEFWRRWHITLGEWMRDYLYIPLGGNRVKSNARLYANLCFVFLLSGLWHGASWNFVIWGVFHGLFLIADRLFLLKVFDKIGGLASTFITFVIVLIGWVFFRLNTIEEALLYIQKLFSFATSSNSLRGIEFKFYIILFIAIFFAFFRCTRYTQFLEDKLLIGNKSTSLLWSVSRIVIAMVLLILSVASLTSEAFNPFIYYRF